MAGLMLLLFMCTVHAPTPSIPLNSHLPTLQIQLMLPVWLSLRTLHHQSSASHTELASCSSCTW